MTVAIAKSVLQALMVVLLMTVIVFFGLHMIGNPVDILIGQDVDQVDRLRIIQELGLDQPVWRQYLAFLNGALHGNLGNSFVYNTPAILLIFQRLPATLELAFAALFLALLVGVPLGLFAGMKPDHPLSRLVMTTSILGFSLPTFWIGLMLIMAFSVTLGWLPSGGRGQTAELFGVQWSWLTADGWRHMILPAINLSLFKISLVIRLTRANVREVLPMDFVKFARAKGLSPARVVLMYVLRNTLIPLVTVVGLEFGSTIAFAVVTESIFAWPGAGKLILDSINALDRPVIVAYLMVIVCMFVTINLVVDVLYKILDPRVRVEAKA
ncbi:ABC transporter permease [Herbaspirillum sp. BH-1]|uniref:Dipeptide/oligopeptide/nickel ABC transporter permease n=2 Tax=Herbaspirillum frisingense TaxID=92645 RepID=A0AAI9N4W0_9BURK|nr:MULTISPECIES: ABC transporter permease [Herbaspirillum]EOA05739.1 dipeptide/oligopeptide/nickel ABC transporter permease [Herbaspirillum frisingense GSF30]MCI1013406.1 ABC transporter permease [Herbaspirillum sp. C7C2]MDR6585475.1 peptide/nickel transport system permease protein [Herbaspirillum frisingense]PLY61496.1 ABC transporter permease [Herbaspirillum sp. BH-1]UIN22985.1 ABC transporter permease [Herbaspirillum frisingense]